MAEVKGFMTSGRAPIDLKRKVYRSLVQGSRAIESLRLRCLGLAPARISSNVMWALAMKDGPQGLGAGTTRS